MNHETVEDDPYLNTLHDSAIAGDIADLGGGYWLAAPLRLVSMSSGEAVLVLGCAPRSVVASIFAAKVFCTGVARFIVAPNFHIRAVTDVLQSVDCWLGPAEPLQTWTDKVIAEHQRRFSTPQELSVDSLEIYAPDVYQAESRVGRWIAAAQASRPMTRPRLCRPLAQYTRAFDRPYYLGDFGYRDGALVLRRSVQIDYKLTGRLRFGFDQMLDTRRSAVLTEDTELCSLQLRYDLPKPEARLMSLGWLSSEAPHSKVFQFHNALRPLLVDVLARLSIVLQSSSRGGDDSP